MSLYEGCLSKIMALTDVDLHEDVYLLTLVVSTYLGMCECAL
jgi:hypothetical protein